MKMCRCEIRNEGLFKGDFHRLARSLSAFRRVDKTAARCDLFNRRLCLVQHFGRPAPLKNSASARDKSRFLRKTLASVQASTKAVKRFANNQRSSPSSSSRALDRLLSLRDL